MKPESPLPWRVHDEKSILDVNDESVLADTDFYHGECYSPVDAAFIVHAANAYPKLVEALKRFADYEHPSTILRELGED